MMITLDTITLPKDLWWEDETEWTPVEQSVEYSTTGALLIDIATKQAGRPITLTGEEGKAWTTRKTVLDLMALAAVPGKEMTLVIGNRSFQVMFRQNEKPIEADPVFRTIPPPDDEKYFLKALRFLILSENLEG